MSLTFHGSPGQVKKIILWADAFQYKSIRPSVSPSVCVSVRVFTFEVPLKCLFAPTSQSRMSNIFRDSETLGKSSSLRFEHFCVEVVLNCQTKRMFFLADFALQIMVETTLLDGLETSGRRVYRYFWHIPRYF